MFFLLLFILPGVRSYATPPSLPPRSYQLPYNTVQFVQHKPAKKGPILFPNDAPPPPPTPLIVTSRPLSESIARSELNPNNTLAAQSQYYQVSFRPEYLARGKNYKPFAYTLATVTPVYDFGTSKLAHGDTAETDQGSRKDNFYKDYENYRRKIWNKPETLKYHHGRRNMMSRQYPSTNNDRNFQLRRIQSRNKLNSKNKRKIHISSIETIEANKDVKRKHRYSAENLSGNIERYDFSLPTRTTPKRLRSYNVASFRMRPVYSMEKESNTNYKIQTRGIFHHIDGVNVNNKQFPKGKVWHRLTDQEEKNLKRRPSLSLEGKSENIDKIIDLPPRNPLQSVEYLSNYLNTKKTSKNIERITPRHEGIQHNKSLHSSGSQEIPQRVVKPLYGVDNVHRQQNAAAKADRVKYQNSPEQIYEDAHDNSKEYNHGENYAFSYTVKDQKTGDDFSHSQQSTGTATNGEYRVRLPDGRMQIVSYTADENGYKADVRYDEHNNQDNSIDVDVSKDNRYRNNELPPKHYTANTYNDHVVHQDSFENEEYLRHRYNDDKKLQQPVLAKRPTSYNNFRPVNEILVNPANVFGDKRDFQNYNDFQTKTAYVDTTKVGNNDHISDGLTDNNNDYLENYNEQLIESNDKVERAKDDDYYKLSDEVPLSKEVIDYSSELGFAYQPHKSKFSAFETNQNEQAKVKPSYDDLKNLFENSRRNPALPVVSTVQPNYAVTPVSVIAITPRKPNLYTNIKNIVPVTPTPFVYSTLGPSTPRNYLLSTIANLKHQINLANKPVLSQQYIDKINKYLTYK